MSHLTSHHTYPPFSSKVPTAPLVSISLAKLENADPKEEAKFYEACKNVGFFYCDMNGSKIGEDAVREAEQLHTIQQQFFKLGRPELEKYAKGKYDNFFAWRLKETPIPGTDKVRVGESLNIRKDDIVGNCDRLPLPQLVTDAQPILLKYTRDCRAIIDLMLSVLEKHLEVEPGTLANLHRITERSGDHVRFNHTSAAPYDELRVRDGEHTDFGTLTVLWNWQGGLQIRLPPGIEPTINDPSEPAYSNKQRDEMRKAAANGHANGVNGHANGVNGHANGVNGHANGVNGHANGVNGANGTNGTNGHVDITEHLTRAGAEDEAARPWVWVKPVPGSAIINLGDALVKFTSGILRSNIHRVVPPPAPQDGTDRFSLVYFSRPEDEVELKRLHGGLIDKQPKIPGEDIGIKSKEWIMRRSGGDLSGVYTHAGGLERRKVYD